MIIHSIYKAVIKPILFKFEPGAVHNHFLRVGSVLGRYGITRAVIRKLFSYKHPALAQTVEGLSFDNPVGLSAGFDKDAYLLNILPSVGFGFSQVGTVTLHPYKGNPKPHAYRLPKSKALVVYYGLKNEGVKKIIPRIKQARATSTKVSISIGKTNHDSTKTTEGGIKDYMGGLEKVIQSGVGDFYTLNISCPNTFGGEPFTTPDKLDKLLTQISVLKRTKPLFLKMPIHLPWEEFRPLLEIAVKHEVNGVIIANLGKDRSHSGILDPIPEHVKGSISGKPTWDASNELISQTYQAYGKKLVIIGVGGIFSAEDAYEKIQRGATLVQLITGMIFEGPQLIGEINRGLVKLMKRDGFESISEAVGTKK
jgi:dihydroorotate dehydrogenase